MEPEQNMDNNNFKPRGIQGIAYKVENALKKIGNRSKVSI